MSSSHISVWAKHIGAITALTGHKFSCNMANVSYAQSPCVLCASGGIMSSEGRGGGGHWQCVPCIVCIESMHWPILLLNTASTN